MKYRGVFCPAVGSSGVIFVRYQLPLCFAFVFTGRVPRDMKNYAGRACIEKRLGSIAINNKISDFSVCPLKFP
jgi:hypothetical protein